MTKNTTLAMPEDNNKKNDIDKKDDKNSLEQVLKALLIQSTKNDEVFKDQIVKINNQVADLSNDQNLLKEDFRGFKEGYIENLRLEPWQKKVIKKHVRDSVRDTINKKYKKNRSIMQIAYSQAYRNLQTFGFNSLDDTKQKFYEDIINAINSGQVTITEKQVLDRYNSKLADDKKA